MRGNKVVSQHKKADRSPIIHASLPSYQNLSSVDSFAPIEGEPPSSPFHTQERKEEEARESDEFRRSLERVRDGIRAGVLPERISQGSSGSYFAKDKDGNILGVFKPKEEEPYAQLNPKWTKWIHKACFPCCFGRSCIMTDVGYISEAGASIVDRFLNLRMVPRTEIVELGARSMSYSLWERIEANKKEKLLEEDDPNRPYTVFRGKIGSFQLFVTNYRSAEEVLDEIDRMKEKPKAFIQAFQREFERLVILDYIIRNTDRSLDNFLIRLEWISVDEEETKEEEGRARLDVILEMESGSVHELQIKGSPKKVLRPIVKIAAIDNGLAFPYKHPDNWRGYPFGWANLEPYVQIPFSPQLRLQLLPFLRDHEAWDMLEEELRPLFRLDPEFNESHFQRQMSLMRGQLKRLGEVLEVPNSTPADLVAKEPILVFEQVDYLKDHKRHPSRQPGYFSEECSTEGHPRWIQEIKEKPLCPSW